MNDRPVNAPKVSIIIPAFNEERRIAGCLASVRAAFEDVGEQGFEVVVCDNNSTDRTAAISREAGARVVFERQNQIARARNTAASEARGKWLIFMDADSRLPGKLLSETLARLGGGRVGAGGALVAFDTARLPWHGRLGLAFWNVISRVFKVAAGTYIFCHREMWEETGGFDERFYAGEEIDFSRKLKQACRRRGMQFEIIRETPVPTSARKIESHSPLRMFGTILRLTVPGALRTRKACAFWYDRRERPEEGS